MNNIDKQYAYLAERSGLDASYLKQAALVNGLNDFNRIIKETSTKKEIGMAIIGEGLEKVRANNAV